jgi:hypothetical protein
MKNYILYVSMMLFSMFFFQNSTSNEDVKDNSAKFAVLVIGWPVTIPIVLGMWAGDEFRRSEFANNLKAK